VALIEIPNLEAQVHIYLDVLIAMMLGGLIGFEREAAQKPAGFRTHTLVAGSAAFLVGLSDVLVTSFAGDSTGEHVRTDPIRIVEAIVTGIAFLGAGTIFRSASGKSVEGLTTAASILLVAAIGICIALEQYLLGIAVTLTALAVLRVIRLIEARFLNSKGLHGES
jgi:putative Mg2+ transporter-C (MgtC) family protein